MSDGSGGDAAWRGGNTQSFINRPQRLDRGQVAVLENGIKRRCDDLVSVGEQLKGVRQDTRQAIDGGELRFLERRRRNKTEASEFNQFKQVIMGKRGGGAGGAGEGWVRFVCGGRRRHTLIVTV